MLVAMLNYPTTFASEVVNDGDSASVTREIDGGLQTIKVTLPTAHN